jgi:zinc D-Ala-D-Ala dipeptidase
MKLIAAITLLLSTTALANTAADTVPSDFTDVSRLAPTIQVQLAYLGHHNFVGRPVDGYLANTCYLQQNAAQALAQAQQTASALGYTLWLFDCYRPQRAVHHFMRWATDLSDTRTKARYYPNLDKSQLVGSYIAEKSGHSRGASVDVTLAIKNQAGQWQPLDMGSAFDLFDPVSNVGAAGLTAQQQANRAQLEAIMHSAGFNVYPMEWWHFSHQPAVYTEQYFDFIVR